MVALLISDSSVYSVKEQIRNVQWTFHWCFFLSLLSAAPRLHRLSLHGDRFALSTTPCLPIVPHLNNSDGAIAKVYGSLKKHRIMKTEYNTVELLSVFYFFLPCNWNHFQVLFSTKLISHFHQGAWPQSDSDFPIQKVIAFIIGIFQRIYARKTTLVLLYSNVS